MFRNLYPVLLMLILSGSAAVQAEDDPYVECRGDPRATALQSLKDSAKTLDADSKVRDVSADVAAMKRVIEKYKITPDEFLGPDRESVLQNWITKGLDGEARQLALVSTADSYFGRVEDLFARIHGLEKKQGKPEFSYIHEIDEKDLIERGRNYAKASEKGCTQVDLRNEDLGPVRDQDSIGWCYAVTAADLLTYKYKKRFSAMDIAMRYNKAPPLGFVDRRRSAGSKAESGIPLMAVSYAVDSGVCLESELPMEDSENGSFRCRLLELEKIWKDYDDLAPSWFSFSQEEKRTAAEALACQRFPDVAALFPGINFPLVLQALENSSMKDFARGLADLSCKGQKFEPPPKLHRVAYRKNPVTIPDFNLTVVKSDTEMLEKLDQQLDAKNLVGIAYDLGVVKKSQYWSSRRTSHASSVVGRRFNPKTGNCEYLIRNSWGRNWNEPSLGLEFEEGNVWLPRQALARTVGELNFLE